MTIHRSILHHWRLGSHHFLYPIRSGRAAEAQFSILTHTHTIIPEPSTSRKHPTRRAKMNEQARCQYLWETHFHYCCRTWDRMLRFTFCHCTCLDSGAVTVNWVYQGIAFSPKKIRPRLVGGLVESSGLPMESSIISVLRFGSCSNVGRPGISRIGKLWMNPPAAIAKEMQLLHLMYLNLTALCMLSCRDTPRPLFIKF
jgi:hypothetical protein